MKHKSRQQKEKIYNEKYGHIPIDYNERLEWLYDSLKISESKAYEILMMRDQMIRTLQYSDISVILFEVPEGSPRPRFRIVNRANLANMAISNPNFVHVYSITGAEDNKFMNRLITSGELDQLNNLICTPCEITLNVFSQTPKSYNKVETILAEIGLDRPIAKPDWDNIEKKYSDMFNKNVWLDDTFVIDGHIHKYYSVLPRIEINLRYLNMVYNKKQFTSIINRKDFDKEKCDLNYFGGLESGQFYY